MSLNYIVGSIPPAFLAKVLLTSYADREQTTVIISTEGFLKKSLMLSVPTKGREDTLLICPTFHLKMPFMEPCKDVYRTF